MVKPNQAAAVIILSLLLQIQQDNLAEQVFGAGLGDRADLATKQIAAGIDIDG